MARIDPAQLDQLLHPMIDPETPVEVIATGLNASPGAASGRVVLDAGRAEELGKAGEAVILVRWETTPDDIHGLLHAKGVLTAHGGMTSHAAVVARGMGKPCVAGCEGLAIDVDAGVAHTQRSRARGRRSADDRRRHGPRDPRPGSPRAASDQRGLRDGARVGGRVPQARRPRERRHARGCGQGARARRGGNRPLPHRAHVHGRGAAAGDAGDDPRRLGGRPPLRARADPPHAAGGLRGHLPRDGRAAGDDPAARSAAARVPAPARGGRRRAHARADSRAPGGEPDARACGVAAWG